MLTRKIEERNEKIIRGLLKLPPNRRCINCNSLGPQYVCTNFWTFVCTTCSGIQFGIKIDRKKIGGNHVGLSFANREFTHRVKSISMSKFTTLEVEALQNGGNQRARELHLKSWDFQRQRFPENSNTDKVRVFIKNVYVDKKYHGGKVSDAQSPDNHEEHKRASSYHSYSQSPPYEHQYEDRKYGKRDSVLTRKPGSDRSLYEGKFSSFMYSPTRMSEQACEERFTNESSVTRFSMHSESSGGDPFRSENMSPSSQSNSGLGSPFGQGIKEWPQTTISYNGDNTKRDQNRVPRPQRTVSSGSFGSFDTNSMSSDSYNFNNQGRVISEQNQNTYQRDKSAESSMQRQHSIGNSSSLNIFGDPVVAQSEDSPTVDLFQLPTVSASQMSSFEASSVTKALPENTYQSSQNSAPSLFDLFGDKPQVVQASTSEQVFSQMAVPQNDGWATFDAQPTSNSHSLPCSNAPPPTDITGVVNLFPQLSADNSVQCKSVQSEIVNQNMAHKVAVDGPYSSIPSPWTEVMHQNQALRGTCTSQSWNAFEDSEVHTQWDIGQQKVEPQVVSSVRSPSSDQLIRSDHNGVPSRSPIADGGPLLSTMYPQTPSAFIPGPHSLATDQKYTNPFDLPFDMASDPDKLFVDMSSLGAALPSNPVQSSAFLGEAAEPWLFHHPVTTYPTFADEASTPYMAGQSQASNFPNIPPHGPLTSIGGNPFA